VNVEQELIDRLRAATRVMVLTGAGTSAESGVPTFRDAQKGHWAKYRPEELATPQAFAKNPKLVWDWYATRRDQVQAVEPNAGHEALAELEDLWSDFTLVTQNVDGLHQRAGSQNVHELHGNITRVKCAREGTQVSVWLPTKDHSPKCQRCGAFLRPDVVWFGESLPPKALEAATHAARNCEVFLSIGTSSVVYPAAGLADLASTHQATIVEINPNTTPLTGRADFVLPGPSGEVLPLLAKRLRQP
jgi:NAD-dependent deacetylase